MNVRSIVSPLALLGLAGCLAASPPPKVRDAPAAEPPSLAARKEKMLRRMEAAMNALVRETQRRLDEIRDGLSSELEALRPPALLVVEDRALRGYGAAEQELYEAEIDRLVARAVGDTVALVGRPESGVGERVVGEVERRAFEAARRIGGGEDKSGIGIDSGVQELDEMAQVTVDLLRTYGDVVALEDLGSLAKRSSLRMSPRFRLDLEPEDVARRAPRAAAAAAPPAEGAGERMGRLFLFGSDPRPDLRVEDQEGASFVVVFRNERLPTDHRYSLVQARRVRVLRGGVVVREVPWTIDPGSDSSGRLPLRSDLVDPRLLASEPLLPALDRSDPSYDRLRDFEVVYDHVVGARDETTGETLGAFHWQVRWGVSVYGRAAWLEPSTPQAVEGGPILDEALARGAPKRRLAASIDRFARLRPPPLDAIQPPERDLGDGRRGRICRYVGLHEILIPPEGRRYLVRHRLRLLTLATDVFSLLDGRRGRYVLKLTYVDPDSAVSDLGFRRNDEILSIDGREIHDFGDLWQYFAEHPRLPRYEVLIDRGGALRRLVYRVEGAPPPGGAEDVETVEPTEEIMRRLESLFGRDVDGG